jgi:nicotinamidase-related amidase
MNNIFDYTKLNKSIMVFIDMQEKLINAMPVEIKDTINRQQRLLKALSVLNMPVIITEQYSKGLGNTIAPLKKYFNPDWPIIEKNTFSCMGSEEVKDKLALSGKKIIILAGIETHVCVLQTALDCIKEGYQVIILHDAVCSRNSIDKETAFITAQNAGVLSLTVESLLFMLLQDSKHPDFKKVSKILASSD